MRVISTLTDGELAKWRMVAAAKDLVDTPYPGYSIQEAKNALIDYYKTLGDLLHAHEVPQNAEGIIVSHITGCILQIDE